MNCSGHERDSDSEQEFQRAVQDNLPLVAHLVRRFSWADADREDLFQTGCLGLMKAVRRYDPCFGTAFSTYAVPVIVGEIRRYLRDNGQLHVARSIRERALAIARCEEMFYAETGRSPTYRDLSDRLGLPPEEIALAHDARRRVISLDAPAPGLEDVPTGDTIPGGDMPPVEEGIVLRGLLAALDEKDRCLIDLRYRQGKTQTETGRILGMTQVQVCRREKKLLQEMRAASGEDGKEKQKISRRRQNARHIQA